MRAGVEHDLVFRRERDVDKYVLPIERPEWRHRARFALGKQPVQFALVGEPDGLSSRELSKAIEIDIEPGRNDRFDRLTVNEADHDLRPATVGHMCRGGLLPSRERRLVRQDDVWDVRVAQEVVDFRCARHKVLLADVFFSDGRNRDTSLRADPMSRDD